MINSIAALKVQNDNLVQALNDMTAKFHTQSYELGMVTVQVANLEGALDIACKRNRDLAGQIPPKENFSLHLVADEDQH